MAVRTVVHRSADVALGAAAQAQKAHERRDLGWWWRRWHGLRGLGAHRFLERSSGCEDAHGQNV